MAKAVLEMTLRKGRSKLGTSHDASECIRSGEGRRKMVGFERRSGKRAVSVKLKQADEALSQSRKFRKRSRGYRYGIEGESVGLAESSKGWMPKFGRIPSFPVG